MADEDLFGDSLDFLAGEDNQFADFNIDSDEEKELDKFINGDLDDPLGILGETEKTEEKNTADEKKKVQNVSNDQSYTATRMSSGSILEQMTEGVTDSMENIAVTSTSSSSSVSASTSNDSEQLEEKGGNSQESSTHGGNSNALKKQVVTEDPLSAAFSIDSTHGVTTTVNTNTQTGGNFVNNTHSASNSGASTPSQNLPYPNASHTVTTSPLPTSAPSSGNYIPSVSSMQSDIASSASTGMANFMSKTQSLTSTFSSLASKVQDAVQIAAHNVNSTTNKHTIYQPVGGMTSPVGATSIQSSRNNLSYTEQSMQLMNSAQNQMTSSSSMQTAPSTVYGSQSGGMNGTEISQSNSNVSMNATLNQHLEMDKAKKSAVFHSAVGQLLSGEHVITFVPYIQGVKETSSAHSNIGSSKIYSGTNNGDEVWCCAMTYYRIILFSFLESEFDAKPNTDESTQSMKQDVESMIQSASVSKQFQDANCQEANGKHHQIIEMPIAAIDRIEKTTEYIPSTSPQMGFSSTSMMGNQALYTDSLNGSVASGTLTIYGKHNGRFIQFTTPKYADCMGVQQQLNTFAFPGRRNLGYLFAFESRKEEVCASIVKTEGDPNNGRITSRPTPRRYDALAEFNRMVETRPGKQCPWRPLLKANGTYNSCNSYPSILFGPHTINDETQDGMRVIREIAAFRSGQRFQTLSWASKHDGASIWRCAQPKVGIQGNRNLTDETYFSMIGKCASFANTQARADGKVAPRPNEAFLRMLTGNNHSSELLTDVVGRDGIVRFNDRCLVKIMDLRPKSSAVANRTQGYGYENTSYYTNTDLSFHGIGNIHVVRDAYQRISALCANPTSNDVEWMKLLEDTKWLALTRLILSASWQAAFHVKYNRLPVLLHCSHGWDRTSQVCALSQIFLDPYFRTREGFACLVEKDFLALGHPFHLRSGHGEGRGDKGNTNEKQSDDSQRSPIFIQFLDCVWQIVNQYPDYFEFNSKYLLTISEHVYSCRFGNLLCDTEKEREVNASIRQRTPCLWEYLDTCPDLLNKSYKPSGVGEEGALMMPLSCLLRNVTLWTDRFCMYGAKPTDRCISSSSSITLAEALQEVEKWKAIAQEKERELAKLREASTISSTDDFFS